MSSKSIVLMLCLVISTLSFAQNKQLWAKSYINEQAPQLNINTWLSEIPNTEGKFIIIDFWATWCKPCRKGIPDMNVYQKEFINDAVVIGISEENTETVKRFRNPKIEYYSGIDTDGTLNATYGIQGIPHVVIIDPKGIVRWEGYPMLSGYELTAEIIKDIIQNYKNTP